MNNADFALCYDVSLKATAIVIGLIYILASLPGIFSTAPYLRFMRQFPRNYVIGAVLTAAAGFWFAILTATTDLGELSDWRWFLAGSGLIGALLQIIFVPTFLAVRGIAMLMLLGVCVVLDSAFLVDHPAKYVMVLLAYGWAIAGIALVASPYLLRDAINYFFRTENQCRLWCGLKAAFGLALVGLGFFIY
jgi:hypothetical protein